MTEQCNRIMIFIFLSIVIVMLSGCFLAVPPFDETAWRKEVESADPALLYAPHFRDEHFFNPWMPVEKRFGEFLYWKFSGKAEYSGEEESNRPKVIPDLKERIESTAGDFIAWIGHGTFLIRANGEYWLTDPIFSERALLPKRKTPPAISLEEFNALPGNKNVIISHNHYDHFDESSIEGMHPDIRIYVPLGLKASMEALGKRNIVEMDWWQTAPCGNKCQVVCLPAQHWSRRISQGTNTTLWASFLLQTPNLSVYYGGDSGYFIGYKEIGRRYRGIDYALLPVTAYHPRWFMHYAHINAREALDAFRDLGARHFIPTQWGTFQLGEEPIGYTALDLRRESRSSNLDGSRIFIMDIGQLLPSKSASGRIPD